MPRDERPREWREFAEALDRLRDALLEPFVPMVEWLIEKLGR